MVGRENSNFTKSDLVPPDWENGQNFSYFGDIYLPRNPLVASRKTGPYRRSKKENFNDYQFIESNPKVKQSLIVIDYDENNLDSFFQKNPHYPTPSLLSIHLDSYFLKDLPFADIQDEGRGHIIYALSTPVCLTDAGRQGPMKYAACIESGLKKLLGGDTGYNGRIMRNPYWQDPLWEYWKDPKLRQENLLTNPIRTYQLKELAAQLKFLNALPTYETAKPLANSMIGRNCYLFDVSRQWSYRQRGEFSIYEEFYQEIYSFIYTKNETQIPEIFGYPLSSREINSIAKSVSHWTWRKIHYKPGEKNARWSKKQAELGKKGGEKGGKISKRKDILNKQELEKFDNDGK